MNVSPLPAEKVPGSFIDNGQTAISIVTLEGVRHGWPLFQLLSWSLSPGDQEKVDIVLGTGEAALLTGRNLSEILDALESGKGGQIQVRDARYLSFAPKTRAFVTDFTLVRADEPEAP